MKNAEFKGFSIYKADTGKMLLPNEVIEMSFPEQKWLYSVANGFVLDWEGSLWIRTDNDSIYRIPKESKYLIKFDGNREFMKW